MTTGNSTEIYEAEDRLPLSQKFWYGFMEIPVTLLESIFMISYFNFFFYNQLANEKLLGPAGAQLGIRLWYIGIFLYTVIDALNDFYFGRWSDKKKEGKYGRRAAFIKICGPIWAVFSVFIWFPWWPAFGASPWVIFVHFLFSMIMFDNLMTIVMINWMALRGEISDSTRERNKLEFSISMSGVVSAVIAFLFIEELEVGTDKFYFASIVVAIVSAIMFWVIGGQIRKSERPELYREQRNIGLIESIKIVSKSRTFVITGIMGFVMMAAAHLGIMTLFLLPIIVGKKLMFVLFIGMMPIGIVSRIVFTKFQYKFDTWKAIFYTRIIGTVLGVGSFLAILFYNPIATTALNDTLVAIIIGIAVIESLLSGAGIYFYSLMVAAIDESEIRTGIRQDGIFAGTFAFFLQIAEGIGPQLASLVILLSGFAVSIEKEITQALQMVKEGLAEQQVVLDIYARYSSEIFNLKLWNGMFGTLLGLVGLVALFFYPLKGKAMEKLRARIVEKRDGKEYEAKP